MGRPGIVEERHEERGATRHKEYGGDETQEWQTKAYIDPPAGSLFRTRGAAKFPYR